jgi:hypothetical protein
VPALGKLIVGLTTKFKLFISEVDATSVAVNGSNTFDVPVVNNLIDVAKVASRFVKFIFVNDRDGGTVPLIAIATLRISVLAVPGSTVETGCETVVECNI